MAMHMPDNNDANFTPPPAGTHRAVCYRVIDLGTQQVNWQGEIKHQHKIMISWELPDELMEDGNPFTIHKRYTYSSSERANLRKDLESWRGQAFTEAEIGANGTFTIDSLLGVPCLLGIAHTAKDGKTYANITSLSRLMKGMDKPQAKNKPVYLGLMNGDFKPEIFDSLSENLRDTIKRSPEYAQLMGKSTSHDPSEGIDDRNPPDHDIDDEIPF